jgi:hypothetical protein
LNALPAPYVTEAGSLPRLRDPARAEETPSIPSRSLVILPVLVLQLWVLAPNGAARTISWSGYNWSVRPPGTAQQPGPNDWSDSAANVRVQGTDLLLSIVKNSAGHWTSAEIDNRRHLGYGTYRWVVATDLSGLDANEVLGMFTYGGTSPSNNEIDIEPSHWGDMSNPTGSVTVWQNANAGLSEGRDFNYSSHPPYVNQFTWSPGRIDYLITDATGATLLAWTVTTGVPKPSTEVPIINYWRYQNVAPAGVRTMRISSFTWAPLGQSLPPVTNPAPPGTGSAGPGDPEAGATLPSQASSNGTPRPPARPPGARLACVIGGTRSGRAVHLTVSMQTSRFPLAWLGRDGVFAWTATGATSLDLIVRRWVRGGGVLRIGALRSSVRSGQGRIRLPHLLASRRVGRGTFSVRVAAGLRPLRCAPGRLVFTIT